MRERTGVLKPAGQYSSQKQAAGVQPPPLPLGDTKIIGFSAKPIAANREETYPGGI
jgi:hypothetical protein